jgi:hypothetical protein
MIRNAVQHSENVRNSLGLNYKSGAPILVIYGCLGPTLYFSALGVAAFSQSLPRMGFHSS